MHVRVVHDEKDLDSGRFPAQFQFCFNAWTATKLLLYDGLFKGLISRIRVFAKSLNYSQLSLNGHLYKTDTWCWSRPFLSHFTITKLSIRRTMDTSEVLNVTTNYDLGKKNYCT